MADSSEQALSHSMTDLMTSLAVIFILLLVVYMSHSYQKTYQGSAQKIQSIIEELKTHQIDCIYDKAKDPLSCTITVADNSLRFASNDFGVSQIGKNYLSGFTPKLTSVLCQDNSDQADRDIDSVLIQGFTDSDFEIKYNLGLSQNRALEVMKFMYEKAGNKKNCFLSLASTNGLGRSRLKYKPDGSEDKDGSRRVEFKIRVKSTEQMNSPGLVDISEERHGR